MVEERKYHFIHFLVRNDELCAKCYVCAMCDTCTMCIFTLRYQMYSKPWWNLISSTSHILHTLQCPLQPLATPRSTSLTSCESSPHPCMFSSIPLRLTTTTLPKKVVVKSFLRVNEHYKLSKLMTCTSYSAVKCQESLVWILHDLWQSVVLIHSQKGLYSDPFPKEQGTL